MVGYSATSTHKGPHKKHGDVPPSADNNSENKENVPSSANISYSPPRRKRKSSLSRTASRISELAKPKRINTRNNRLKTSPPNRRYSDINVVAGDPFRSVRDLPRTPVGSENNENHNLSFSPTTSMYRIDNTVDLIELGPSDSHFLSPILIRAPLSPVSSPIRPFSLPPSSPSPMAYPSLPPLSAQSYPQQVQTLEEAVLDESQVSHLSEVSLGNATNPTPQKPPKLQKSNKTVSQFDLRTNSGSNVAGVSVSGGQVTATPKRVVLNGGKRRQTFSPREHPDLTLADMLHDLSFGTDKSDEMPVAEDVAEVSKEEFLWSMKSGFEFTKHGRRGKPHKRLVWFDLELGAICWNICGGKKRIKQKKTMKLHEILDIVFGRANPDPNVCFSIVGQKRTLDLECNNEQVRDFWMSRFYLLKILQHEIQA